MELAYVYLDEYEGVFSDTEFNFSRKFQIHFDKENRELMIEKCNDLLGEYYGANVKNVTLFLGKNGVGKTTLLDIIGMKRDDRSAEFNAMFSRNKSGFILYHLEGNLFVVESLGAFLFVNIVRNLDKTNMNEFEPHYKDNISFVFEWRGEKLVYRKQLINNLDESLKISNTIKYAYISADSYSSRIKYNNREKAGYLFEREYYLNNSVYEYIYNYFVLIKALSVGNNNKSFGIDIAIKPQDELKIGVQTNSRKEAFLNKFYISVCGYYYELYKDTYLYNNRYLLDDEKEKIGKELDRVKFYFSGKYDSYNQLKDKLKTFEEEFDFDEKNNYYKVYDLLLSKIEKLPEKYFSEGERICIDCNMTEPDAEILSIFRLYDELANSNNQGVLQSNILSMLKIEAPIMSEGQLAFIRIISQAISSIAKANVGDTIILLIDEPDRAMHPEMARCFLDVFLEEVNEWKNRNVQMVISSHSPFIATDILPEDVYRISIYEGERIVDNGGNAFASNIYNLLKDTFMLSKVYGEYSRKVIKEIIEKLNDSEYELTKDEELKIRRLINSVGEDALRRELQNLLYKKVEQFDKRNLMLRIMSTNDKVVLKEIERVLNSYDKN